MKTSVEFGDNKTPTQLQPLRTAEMADGLREFPPHAEDTSVSSFLLHEDYIQNSDSLGSVPPPLSGHASAMLMDKLGERLAYERSGSRLYDAFITKCRALRPDLSLTVLEQFRDEETEHFALVRDCIRALGGDPTAQTPCADASGVASMGLLQLVSDPRSSIQQCTEAMLVAELTDVAAWDLLVELMDENGKSEFGPKFLEAKKAEDRHLDSIKQWLRQMTLKNDVVPVPVPSE